MINWLLNLLNPCVHVFEIVATLKDDEDRPQAVKIIQACTACGRLRERTLRAPGWCDHSWYTTETIRVFHANDDGKEAARPIGFAKIQKCHRCGDVKRVNLYDKATGPAAAEPLPARTAG